MRGLLTLRSMFAQTFPGALIVEVIAPSGPDAADLVNWLGVRSRVTFAEACAALMMDDMPHVDDLPAVLDRTARTIDRALGQRLSGDELVWPDPDEAEPQLVIGRTASGVVSETDPDAWAAGKSPVGGEVVAFGGLLSLAVTVASELERRGAGPSDQGR